MTGLELQNCGTLSDCFTNCATANAPYVAFINEFYAQVYGLVHSFRTINSRVHFLPLLHNLEHRGGKKITFRNSIAPVNHFVKLNLDKMRRTRRH